MPKSMRLSRPAMARHGAHFAALRIDAAMFGREGSPWFALDHFRMTGPTFPPHPHAGFSAVTYVLPRAATGMRNQDSLGDKSVIDPGGLHWTAAGRGVVHEEIPARAGQVCEGFQIFIRQPPEQERDAPAVFHRAADAIPVWHAQPGVSLRLLSGAHDGRSAGFTPPTPLTMIDATLEPGAAWTWSRRPVWNLCLYLYEGRLNVDGQVCDAPLLISAPRDQDDPVTLRVNDKADGPARVLVMTGEPIDAPLFAHGPFAMASTEAIEAAIDRYQAGAMGTLAPMAETGSVRSA